MLYFLLKALLQLLPVTEWSFYRDKICVHDIQCRAHGHGQVIELSTSGRLAALLRAGVCLDLNARHRTLTF